MTPKSRKTHLGVFVMAIAIQMACSIQLEPPQNQWARVGSQIELLCKSDKAYRSCSWETPYGKLYTLFDGVTAESGRLSYSGSNEYECGLNITDVQAQDGGKWTCNLNIVQDGEVTSAKGEATLTIAQKPDSVKLLAPFNSDMVNITVDVQEIKCMVENAIPEPTFSWFIDDTILDNVKTENVDGEDGTWTQVLYYEPSVAHDNKTLKCVAQHVGYGDQDDHEKEAVVVLRFTEEEIRELENKFVLPPILDDENFQKVSLTIFLAVVIFIIVTLILWKFEICCFWEGRDALHLIKRKVDAERAEQGLPSIYGSEAEKIYEAAARELDVKEIDHYFDRDYRKLPGPWWKCYKAIVVPKEDEDEEMVRVGENGELEQVEETADSGVPSDATPSTSSNKDSEETGEDKKRNGLAERCERFASFFRFSRNNSNAERLANEAGSSEEVQAEEDAGIEVIEPKKDETDAKEAEEATAENETEIAPKLPKTSRFARFLRSFLPSPSTAKETNEEAVEAQDEGKEKAAIEEEGEKKMEEFEPEDKEKKIELESEEKEKLQQKLNDQIKADDENKKVDEAEKSADKPDITFTEEEVKCKKTPSPRHTPV